MSKFTVLGASDRVHLGCADPININGEFGATVLGDEGSTHAWTTALRMEADRKQFVKKFVGEQWILSCKSLGRSLVYYCASGKAWERRMLKQTETFRWDPAGN